MGESRRLLLRGPGIVLAAGAHDALSAKLAEQAGFDAIWAGGFGISAVQAVPDANILTLTETLEAVRRIVDAVAIPVVADCDNGYGNAINVMRTAAEFERAGAAGICIEDNEFPKRCSFYAGVRRKLVPAEEHARTVEERIAPLEEVYALVGVPELRAHEQRFLFAGDEAPRAGILAVGFEPQVLPLIQDRPKAMLEVKGRTILERQVEALHHCGVRDVVVVRGYRKERIALPGLRFVDNDRFAETGEVGSLFGAERELDRPFVLLYGDILFDPAVLVKLLQTRADVAVVVDRAFHDAYRAGLGLQ